MGYSTHYCKVDNETKQLDSTAEAKDLSLAYFFT